MSDLLQPRDYQQECIDALYDHWSKGHQRVAAVLPTGAGKTVIFSHLSKRHRQEHPEGAHRKVLILAHTDELVTQAYKKFKMVAPHLRVGIVKAGRNDVTAEVIVGSVQTLRNEKRRDLIRHVGLVIIDECHHSTSPTYRAILEHFDSFNPDSGIKVAGFTATLARGDKAKLSDIWQEVAYRKDIPWMIGSGYLLDVRGKRIEVPDLDLGKVKKVAGDYSKDALGEAITASMAPSVVAKAYVEHASDRSGLVFTPTVASAYVMSEHLNEAGIRTDVVHGGLQPDVRKKIIAQFEAGEIQVISNCMVLTEGFDAPIASAIVIARPTRSAPLYQQMIGRGLRLYPGQTEALVLDVVGASKAHDLRSLVDLTTRRETDCEDCSLMEMEEQAERREREIIEHDGPVEVSEFDPLVRASKRTWLVTAGGTYFLSAGDEAYIFLSPSAKVPGSWDVAWCSKGPNNRKGGYTDHIGIGMDYALAWGEDVAEEMGGPVMNTYTNKKASWRGKRASEKQIGFADRLGLKVDPSIRSGDLSALIDTHLASQRIDPIVTAIMMKRSGTA